MTTGKILDLLDDRYSSILSLALDILPDGVLDGVLSEYAERWDAGEDFAHAGMEYQRVYLYGRWRIPTQYTRESSDRHPLDRKENTDEEMDAFLECVAFHIRDLSISEWGKKISRSQITGLARCLIAFSCYGSEPARVQVGYLSIPMDELLGAWNATHPSEKPVLLNDFS